jgi:hypothetical protein
MGPDQWQQFQNELSQGYFSPTTSPNGQSGLTLNTNLLPKVMGVIGLNPDLQNAGGGFASLGSNSSSPITQNMINKNAMSWDPNYGWVTSQANIKTPENFFEKAGNFVGDIAPYAIMAAMSAGFGGLNPEAFGSLFSSLPKIAQGVDQGGAQGGAAAALPQLLNVLRNW